MDETLHRAVANSGIVIPPSRQSTLSPRLRSLHRRILRHFADHPIWAKNPKLAMLPKEAEYAHPRGWPSKPNDAIRRIENNYILPDMVAKAVNGMPTKRVMDWAQEQVVQAVRGQLKASG